MKKLILGLLLGLLPFAAIQETRGQTRSIYYVRMASTEQIQLARVNPDGTDDQALNVGLAFPTFPSWSKDGSILLLTSVNPQRPSKISQDVFAFLPALGRLDLVVPFEDLVTTEPIVKGGVTIGQQNKFSYVVPLYKALSPDHQRIAVASIITSGFFQSQQPDPNVLTGTSQTPMLQIYRVANGAPEELVSLGRIRTLNTLGGFGVDWHPTQNLLVAPIDVDATTIGSVTPSESSALFLVEAVPNAINLGKGRQLTRPQGSFLSTPFGTTSTLRSDYAPVFSPDGQTVAYLRAENTADGVGGVVQHRPIVVSIRAVDFDGSNDRLVLQLAAGIFTTQLSWSPDGRQLAFDTGNQPVPQPLQSAKLEAIPNTLQLSVVNGDGTNPRLVRAAPAGMPAWQLGSGATALPQLAIRVGEGEPRKVAVSWPATGQAVTVESSPALGSPAAWKPLPDQPTTANGVSTVTIPVTATSAFFRVRPQ